MNPVKIIGHLSLLYPIPLVSIIHSQHLQAVYTLFKLLDSTGNNFGYKFTHGNVYLSAVWAIKLS